jgi:para-nitrobenzyl esterase
MNWKNTLIMKNCLFILLFFAFDLKAQTACSLWPRYDQEVFSQVNVTSDVTYGSNSDYQNVPVTLKMDIYEPDGDTLAQRPLIIFAHGGSFVAGDKSNSDQVDLCTHFAKRGYVCATINYRLGIAVTVGAATATDAVFRSMQDMKAAIRFFRKDASTTNLYKIDPNIIFIGGSSAGAFAALQTAYLNTYPELPATIDTSVIGDLEGNSGNPGYSTSVNAVINLCGALGDANWIIPGDIPVCSMHGTNDQVVPYGHQMLYLFGIIPILVVDGSSAIHAHLLAINHPSAMYTWYGAPHVPYDGSSAAQVAYLDTTLRFVSNFLYSYLTCTPSNPDPLPNTYTAVGIKESEHSQDLELISNFTDENIVLRNNGSAIVHIQLYDSRGLKVKYMSAGNGLININSSGLATGIYFLEAKTVDKQWNYKIVEHH